MKKILLILLLNSSLMTYAKSINSEQLQYRSDVCYEINSQTPYTGEAVFYYENSEIEGKGNFKNGLENGKWIAYYENGQIKVLLQQFKCDRIF